ncbi:multicopper oxidase family protein [Methylibium sp.]|uniref:multicopper oxidase family protein n=1 Tax=Methylibium sp. TaxID=2067992 RepID=UPI0025FBE156|nr:multicopper oxidase domain-containing protein [Methylibium sp.]
MKPNAEQAESPLPPLAAPKRRDFFKTAALGGVCMAAPWVAQAQTTTTTPQSPYTEPWRDELEPQKPLQPVASLSPAPGKLPVAGEVGRAAHQAWDRFPPQKLYDMHAGEYPLKWHKDLPEVTTWGFNDQCPGPMIHARYGEPILVRMGNELRQLGQGYGSPEISIHLHNMHTPSESDGFPIDWWSPTDHGPTLTGPGHFKDHHYPMVYAGVDQYGGIGDEREALGTLWYHDHRIDFTAQNTYRGLSGFFLAYDHIDNGDEHDLSSPTALRLPSGDFDQPFVLADKRFTPDGVALSFDPFDNDGFVGDKMTVNGRIQPFYNAARRKYRLRLLNAGPARNYDLQLRLGSPTGPVQKFQYIANDGNLLPAPLTMSSVRLAVAERADIVFDFSLFQKGSEVFLVNRLNQLDGRKPEKDFLRTPVPILKFEVDRDAQGNEEDESRVPALLRPLPNMDQPVEERRTFTFDRTNGAWAVNSRLFKNRPVAFPKKGTAEIWKLRNDSGGWAHPIHIHLEEGRILKRNGKLPPPHERGRKDVFYLGPNETLEVYLRFRDFTGKYVMHCHNTVHEDHSMMVRYDIV